MILNPKCNLDAIIAFFFNIALSNRKLKFISWMVWSYWDYCGGHFRSLLSTYCVPKGNIGWKNSCHNERWGTQSFWGRSGDVQRLDDFAWRIAQSCLSPSKKYTYQISVAHHMVSRMPNHEFFRILPEIFCLFFHFLTLAC